MVRALYAGSVARRRRERARPAIVLVTALRRDAVGWRGARRRRDAARGRRALLGELLAHLEGRGRPLAALHPRQGAGRAQRRQRHALAIAAFLAVYREGFETILFYQALFAGAPAGDVMVPAGLVAGLVLLAIVYWGLERVGLRVPMGAFFVGTGAFLYAMAIVFAGRGVAELQEAALAAA